MSETRLGRRTYAPPSPYDEIDHLRYLKGGTTTEVASLTNQTSQVAEPGPLVETIVNERKIDRSEIFYKLEQNIERVRQERQRLSRGLSPKVESSPSATLAATLPSSVVQLSPSAAASKAVGATFPSVSQQKAALPAIVPVEDKDYPKLSNVSLAGTARVGSTLSLTYEYTGGLPAPPSILWYSGNHPRVQFNNKLQYALTLTDVGQAVHAQITPVRSDGVVGQTKSVSSSVVEVPNELSISGVLQTGEVLTAVLPVDVASSVAGVRWFRVVSKQKDAVRPACACVVRTEVCSFEAGNPLRYVVQEGDLGHYLEVELIPQRGSDQLGYILSCRTQEVITPSPPLIDVAWKDPAEASAPAVGATLRAVITVQRGTLGTLRTRWLRGRATVVAEDDSLSYRVQVEDLGCTLELQCLPLAKAAGCVPGPTRTLTSGVVQPTGPQLSQLALVGELAVGAQLALVPTVYVGPAVGEQVAWFRVDSREPQAHVKIAEDVMTLVVPASCVEHRLAVQYTPLGLNGMKGKMYYTVTTVAVGDSLAVNGGNLASPVPITAPMFADDKSKAAQPEITPKKSEDRKLDSLSDFLALLPPDVPADLAYKLTNVACGKLVTAHFPHSAYIPHAAALMEGGGVAAAAAALGKSYVWWRSMDGIDYHKVVDPETLKEGMVSSHTYLATADDLNCFLKCEFAPPSGEGTAAAAATATAATTSSSSSSEAEEGMEEGEENESAPVVETEARVVRLPGRHQEELKKMLETGSVSVDATVVATGQLCGLTLTYKGVRVVSAGKALARAAWAVHSAVTYVEDSATQLKIRLSPTEEFVLDIKRAVSRDIVVLCFRAYMGMSLPSIAPQVVGEKAYNRWCKGEFSTLTALKEMKESAILNAAMSQEQGLDFGITLQRWGLPWWQAKVTLEYALTETAMN